MSELLKLKLIELIEEQDIKIKYTYRASFLQNATFNYTINKWNTVVPQYIEVPKLIDDDYQMSMLLAHELGHYYAYNNMSASVKNIIIKNENSYVKYYNEKLAWKEAKKIITDLGFWTNEVERYFESFREHSLNSYRPKSLLMTVSKLLFNLTKFWIISYLIISFFCLAVEHNIPIPFINDFLEININRELFFILVNTLFGAMILISFIKRLHIYLMIKNGFHKP